MKKLFNLLFGKKTNKPVENPKETNTVTVIRKRYRELLAVLLEAENLVFIEHNSRMDYGMIGRIFRNGELAIVLYGNTFYVHDKNIPINTKNLKLIRDLQREFKDVTRNEHGRISVNEKGFGVVEPSSC